MLACDSLGAEFSLLDTSFSIIDLSALDFGRDSIAIYDIKSAGHKAESQSRGINFLRGYDQSLHQIPILLPKEGKWCYFAALYIITVILQTNLGKYQNRMNYLN